MNAAEVLTACLEQAGVRRVYGLIGTTLLGLIDALRSRRKVIRYLSARHEQAAASMADGDARVSGHPGIVLLHSGPGVLNAALSVGIAARDHVPLIVIAATVRRRLLRQGHSFDIGQLELLQPLCKTVRRLEEPAEIGPAFLEAYRLAATPPRGPVYLEVPEDVWTQESAMPELSAASFAPAPLPSPDHTLIEEVARALSTARRPALLVGGELACARAAGPLRRLVESQRLALISSGQGRGLLPEDHELCFGRAGFAGGATPGDVVFGEADVLLALGARLTDLITYDFTAPCEARLYSVDTREPAPVVRPRLAGAARCNTLQFLEELAARLQHEPPPEHREAWLASLEEARQEWGTFLDSYRQPREPLAAGYAMTRLSRLLPRDALLCVGMGAHTVYGNAFFPRFAPHTYLASTNFGAMSFGLPAALGAALAAPQRTSCAILGDGEFLMAVQELETAVREKLPVRIIVLNDNSYRVLLLRQKLQLDGRFYGSIHTNPDFVALAEAYGAKGYRIERSEECDRVFKAALQEEGPALVELGIDPEELPPVNLEAVFAMQNEGMARSWPVPPMERGAERRSPLHAQRSTEAERRSTLDAPPSPEVDRRSTLPAPRSPEVERRSTLDAPPSPHEGLSLVWPPLERCRLACFSPVDEARLRGLLARAGLRKRVAYELSFILEATPVEQVAEFLAHCDLVISDYSFRIPITAAMLRKAGPIRLIQQPSTGYDHIDLEAATSRGIAVANTATANTEAVAEHTVAAALALLKRFFPAHRATSSGEWPQLTLGAQELTGKTWSILGMGRIGREVARRVRALGAKRILYYDLRPLSEEQKATLGATEATLEEGLRSGDVVSLHLPLTEETHGLLDAERLRWLRPSAYLVNVARGELIDEAALARLLHEGHLAGAALDVYREEPLPATSPLTTLQNVILTPHTAGATAEAQERIIAAAIANIGRAIMGQRPADVLNASVLP